MVVPQPSVPVPKLNRFITYSKHTLIGIISLPIALIISTALIIIAVMLLPILWALVTLVWVNNVRTRIYDELSDDGN